MKSGTVLALALLTLAVASPLLLPRHALALDEEQGRKACMTDALTVCAQFIPDRQQIASCLMSNRQRISEPCRILIGSGPGPR
jgi:hypothetical protein